MRPHRLVALLLGAALIVGAAPAAPADYRLRAGTPDPSFGEGGVVAFEGGFGGIGVATHPDGLIIVVGTTWAAETGSDAFVAWLDPSGEVVGAVQVDHGPEEAVTAMAAGPDGALTLAGAIPDPETGFAQPAFSRLTPDGELDPAFGRGGQVVLDVDAYPSTIAVTPDGGVVFSGMGPVEEGATAPAAGVGRLTPSGDLDRSFGDGGLVRYQPPLPAGWGGGAAARALAVQPDGRIVVGFSPSAQIVRLLADGSFDRSFGGGDGVAGPALSGNTHGTDSVVVAPDGKLLTVGERPVVRRYQPDGTPDRSFGTDGAVDLPAGGWERQSTAIDADARLYIASEASGAAAVIRRLLPGGRLDPSFGGYGEVFVSHGDFAYYAKGIALDGAGGLLVAGSAQDTNVADLTLHRLLTDDVVVDEADPPIVVTPGPPGDGGPASAGYWAVDAGGTVHGFGGAPALGGWGPGPQAEIVDIEPAPWGAGYWLVDSVGRVEARGSARPHSFGPADLRPGERVTSLSATASGRGYWLFTDRGRVVPFGDAPFLGDMSAVALNSPVLDSVTTRTIEGYYMVAADGGIFAFGDATFHGSMGATRLNAPVQSLVPDPDGVGYWLVAADGGVFAFDSPFRGSTGGKPLNRPVTGMVSWGDGYLMVAEDGGMFSFSDQPFLGSLGQRPPARPVVAVAAI